MMPHSSSSVLNEPVVEAVLDRLYQAADRQVGQLFLHYLPKLPGLFTGKGLGWDQTKTEFYRDKYIPIDRNQGELLYLLARSLNAKTIVEFGTSLGISTIYLAAAVRDNGGGIVIGTEIVSKKVAQAQKHIAEAGLSTYVEIREGDALKSLKNLNRSIDLVLMDGWPNLALEVLQLLDPLIRVGGIVVADNVATFRQTLQAYVEFLRNPNNGYRSSTLNLKSGTELSVKVNPP